MATKRKRRAPAAKKVVRRRKRARKNPLFGKHRPVLRYTPAGWKRSKKSKLFKKRTRINRKRRIRRNPSIAGMFSQRNIMQAAKLGAGVAMGFIATPLLNKVIPVEKQSEYGKYLGGLQFVAGAMVVGFVRNKDVKDVAMIVSAMGLYDLLATNLPDLGLPPLPRAIGLTDKMVPVVPAIDSPATEAAAGSYALPVRAGYGASYPAMRRPVSRVASMQGSYESPNTTTQGLAGLCNIDYP